MGENVQSAGGVVINRLHQIIVTQTEGVFWTMPKGRIEANEEPLNTAIREIYEETGISDLKLIKFLGSYKRSLLDKNLQPKPDAWKTITVFLFHTDQNSLSPRDPNITAALWADKEHAIDLLTHPQDREFLLQMFPDILTSIDL